MEESQVPAVEESDAPLELLDLKAAERTAQLRIAGRTAIHFFRPLTLDDWLEYLKRAPSEFTVEGEKMTPEGDDRVAAEWLWDRRIIRVEGYRAPDEEWKQRMPLAHKAAAVALLQEVYAQPSGDPFDLTAGAKVVELEAGWNGRRYEGLKHVLRPPSPQQEKDYRMLRVTTWRQRGFRRAPLRIRSALLLGELTALWDQLVAEVHGYAGYSAPRDMCPLHKQAAVVAMMERPSEEE